MSKMYLDLNELEEIIPGSSNYHNLPRKKKKAMRNEMYKMMGICLSLIESASSSVEKHGKEAVIQALEELHKQ